MKHGKPYYYVLCPKDEVKLASLNNSNAYVIGYDNISSGDAAKILIKLLGYKLENILGHGWADEKDNNAFYRTVKNENFHDFAPDFGSDASYAKRAETSANLVASIIECVKNNNIELTPEELTKIFDYSGAQYGTSGRFDEGYLPQIISALKEKNIDFPLDSVEGINIGWEKLKETNLFNCPSYYAYILSQVSKVILPTLSPSPEIEPEQEQK